MLEQAYETKKVKAMRAIDRSVKGKDRRTA
jgi:hypothetical protein